MTFAHYPGEDPEQTAATIASLEVALQAARDHGDAENEKLVQAELRRLRGDAERQTRPRGAGAQKRVK